jgi:hypothetical protein
MRLRLARHPALSTIARRAFVPSIAGDVDMLMRLPRLAIALLAIQAWAAGWLCYEAYNTFHSLAGCQSQLGKAQRMETQTTDLEAQLGKREAALDAAEAELNDAKPQ